MTLKNSVRLIGFFGKDPELKTFDDGHVMARVSMATNDRYKDRKGEWREDTQWHNLVLWGNLAQMAVDNLKTGAYVMVEGKLLHRSYMNQEESLNYITEVRVNNLLVFTDKSDQVGLTDFDDPDLSP